jgi:hypothetical protein
MTQDRNISYLNKTFGDFKQSLRNYAKTYFPDTYGNFSESDPGMVFVEMASYIGDNLSFYLDTQFQENLLLYTKQKENIISLAYALGYRPKMSYASTTLVDIYQLIPITTNGGVQEPEWSYGLLIPANTPLSSASTGVKFLTTEKVDFTDETAEISIYDSNFFLARRSVRVIAGEIKTATFNFTSPIKFNNVSIEDTNIIQILSAVDDSMNVWYEVPYLAQDTVLNKSANGSFLSDGVPYTAQVTKVPRRFVSRFLADGSLQLQFGAGTANLTDLQILPTPDTYQIGQVATISDRDDDFNKASIFFAKEYGVAPSDLDLTVTYIIGGGIESNVPAGDITRLEVTLDQTYFTNGATPLDPFYAPILTNFTITNPNPASGGRDGDTVEEIRLNTLYAFAAQNRAVTREDYIMRSLSMPAHFGSVAKAYVTQDALVSRNSGNDPLIDNNPLALSLYILGYDGDKKLETAPLTLKNNLKTYLQQYRMVTDAINIKNAYILNIGINFDITVIPGVNNKEVLQNCLIVMKNYFNIDRWQINQPIVISELYSELLKIRGVQSVVKVEVINKQDGNYSQYGYDIKGATRNNVIYPSLDPSIFEVKYPDSDIQGRIIVL